MLIYIHPGAFHGTCLFPFNQHLTTCMHTSAALFPSLLPFTYSCFLCALCYYLHLSFSYPIVCSLLIVVYSHTAMSPVSQNLLLEISGVSLGL
ncbi:hypothetical protein J3R30DRAFT_2423319 [Lentinula aciculospora]|uniref:Uncharacterized protein n=1 Tax=Lentinula aciculospora TaxID=153920 RepID=A0A9W9AHS4_9AGAR|nr:hypothetical protein J3R30DRAFT_2423319 [Lentinula aciculospora]